jgi:hypothetical protein
MRGEGADREIVMMRFEAIEIGAEDGFIVLRQRDSLGNGDAVIFLYPEQVVSVIDALRSAREAAQGGEVGNQAD